MKIAEILAVTAVVLGLAAIGICGSAHIATHLPQAMGAEPGVVSDQRQPINRGDASHDGLGRPWTHDDHYRPLPPCTKGVDSMAFDKVNVMYSGYPYGR